MFMTFVAPGKVASELEKFSIWVMGDVSPNEVYMSYMCEIYGEFMSREVSKAVDARYRNHE